MRPIDVATQETLDFLQPHLVDVQRLLEIGCGRGDLARVLSRQGYEVVAIDTDPEAVEAARGREVDARNATWPAFDDGPFDAILFTRSLHHLPDLDGAVERARDMLNPEGWLLVEDFALESIDPSAASWFYGMLQPLVEAGQLQPPPDSLVASLLAEGPTTDPWRRRLDEGLHPASRMRSVIRKYLSLKNEETAPYFYRYLIQAVGESRADAELAGATLSTEVLQIEKRRIQPLGWRAAAQKSR